MFSLKSFFSCLIVLLTITSLAQKPATLKEYEKTFTTYPFSLPDPVPNPTPVYPYFRFDGFTDNPVQQKWKIVELENDFIKVLITPQIGGKIWTAIDKKANKPFIYNNDAVKFRDIAMRGPWTSGGLEANFGIIGHTPGVATPVNYLTQQNADGSVSCTVSLLDLLTQTRWNMEINLPKDKAYFITRFVWHNGSGIEQPYYTWMNLGEKVTDSLEYIEPGNHYLGHDGSVHPWPYDSVHQKQMDIYNQNDFGSYKSYHVTGVYSKYFGTFWRKENYGMMHYAERQDKIGKKVWIWGLSRQGMIWEKLLTDNSGQYTELQSGRLYNQNAEESVLTPFKSIGFAPYTTDTWEEHWYPFQNTDGVVAADLNGVFNIRQQPDNTTLFFSPVSYINDTLKVFDTSGNILFNKKVVLQPLQSFQQKLTTNHIPIGKIIVAGSEIILNKKDSIAKVLSRPLHPYPDFDWNSAYGLYIKGKYLNTYRRYADAENNIRASLKKDPAFVPALSEMAFLQYRKMNYDSAFYYARTALSMDTYDAAANYYYGLSALKLNKQYDAADGFEVAAITPLYRTAAYTELSKMQLQKQEYQTAYDYATKALVYNTDNISALQLQYLAARLMNNITLTDSIKNKIIRLDALNHFIRFEDYWHQKTDATQNAFTNLIRDELPQQTYLQLAIWYYQYGIINWAEKRRLPLY